MTLPPQLSFHLLEGEAYLETLCEDIERAKKRITIVAMVGLWGEETGRVYSLLVGALEKGVKVRLVFDVYSRLFIAKEDMSYLQHRKHVLETQRMDDRLRGLGAEVSYIEKVTANPFKGRCHVKLTVVDNHVYSFGGVNFYDGAFENADYMLATENKALADRLDDLAAQLAHEDKLQDFELPIAHKTAVLYDAGAPKKSIVYERACELAAHSRKIYYVSQMVPSGRLGELIGGVEHKSYFNRLQQVRRLPNKFAQFTDQRRTGIRNSYQRARYIHAKFILFELKDGTKALVTGSHNFNWRGVSYGTKEIALYSTDEHLWHQLYNFMRHEVMPAGRA